MPFSISERKKLLAVKGIGPAVITRLEQMGFDSLWSLRNASAVDIVSKGALLTGSSCWKNSPQARSAVQGALECARQEPLD